jgi:pilus assembly protein CpaE
MTKQQPTNKKRGELIAVCSAKGGVGRTIITVNLAVALCKKNIQIGVVDGDFQFGDIGLAFDLQTTFDMKDVVQEIDNLDEYGLGSYLSRHESGVRVLPAPDRPEYSELMDQNVINNVLDMMLLQHDYVIVDTGVGLHEQTLHVVEKADQILLLTNLEMATLKNTRLMIETFETLDMRDKVQVIVNRSTMESVIKANDVPEILGDETPLYIPNDFQIASQSLNIGIPFVINHGKTELAKSIFKMAEQLTSRRDISLLKPETPSLISRLLQKPKRLKEETTP